jgi:hypothetical protein
MECSSGRLVSTSTALSLALARMAATRGSYSPVDCLGAFYPLHQRSEAAKSLPPIKPIGIHEFYERIGKNPAPFAKEEDKRDTGSQQPQELVNERTELPAKEKKEGKEHAFEQVKIFIEFLKSLLKEFEGNGN